MSGLYRRGDVFDGDLEVWIELGRLVPVEIPPAVNIVLTVATAQLARGDTPPPSTSAVAILFLDELVNGTDGEES